MNCVMAYRMVVPTRHHPISFAPCCPACCLTIAVRLNPEKAAGKKMTINIDFRMDINIPHSLSITTSRMRC